MPVPTTFDMSRIQNALGAKSGASQPSFANEVLFPLLVVGDMSDSFGAQKYEARAFADFSFNATPFPAERAVMRLTALSPGGIVIERVDVTAHDGGAPSTPDILAEMFVTTVVQPAINNTGTTPVVIINVGGVPVRSFGVSGSFIGGPVSASFDLDAFGQKTYENFGWFVPSGAFFQMQAGPAGGVLHVQVQWREIPQAAGGQ